MNNKSFRFMALASLSTLTMLVSMGCQVSVSLGPTATPAATPTFTPTPPAPTPTPLPPTPTPAPSPTAPPAGLALQDNFSDNRNNWLEGGPDDVGNEIAVRDGAYHVISVFEEEVDNFIWGATDVQEFTDFDLQVLATQVAGSTDNNEISVVFGILDSDNFYEFAYSGDGFLMLGRYVDGEWEFIEEWVESDAINLGDSRNTLRLLVEDGTLTAYLNGSQALEAQLPGYQGGFIGFGCGPFEAPEAHCTFDNLEVAELGGGLPPAAVTFAENFSDNRNAWFEYGPDDAANEIYVGAGTYNFLIQFDPADPNQFFWGATDVQEFNNFRLEVEASERAGTHNNQIQVILGIEDNENFYIFAYSGDGFVMAGRVDAGGVEFLQEWSPSAAIVQGRATNQIEVTVENGLLTASINGSKVLDADLPGYRGGLIGFGCGALEAPSTVCAFDNLQVTEL